MSWRVAALSLIAPVVAMFALPAVSDDRRGGEFGVTIGAVAADENLTAKSDVVEGVVGLRGGSVFSSRWGWYVDFLHANIENQARLGDASTFVGRTGFDVLFAPEKDARWLLTFGAGWMAVDFDQASAEDFHNPIASAGFGQRVRVGPSLRFRWELRVDTTLDDARLAGEDLVMGYALFSFNWGPRGKVRGATGISTGHDHDGDGVRNHRDRCPDTPAGSQVAANGCPLDDDRGRRCNLIYHRGHRPFHSQRTGG